MSLRKKLIILLLFPLIIILSTNGFTLFKNQETSDRLIAALYEDTFVPSALILNADRDMYQALLAQRTLIYMDNADRDFEAQVEAYHENVAQVKERVNQAAKIFSEKVDFSALISAESQRSLTQMVSDFNQQFSDWEKESNAVVEAVSLLPRTERVELIAKAIALDEAFEVSRNNLNEIGELLEAYAQSEMSRTKEGINRLFITLLVIVIIASIGIFLLITFLMNSIRTALRKIATVTEKVAEGDLSVEKLTVNSNDEFGKLGMTVNRMVQNLRDLIKNILEAGRYVVDSSNQLKISAEETSKASEQISLTIQDVAAGSAKQSQNLFESSRLIDEVAQSLEHIALNAQEASRNAEKTTEVAVSGERSIDSLTHTWRQ